MQISELLETQIRSLASAERLLQEQLDKLPAARATKVSHLSIAHVARLSTGLSETLRAAADEASIDLSGGSPTSVATLILNEVGLPDAPTPSNVGQPMSNYHLIAAMVRYTHNRIAELSLIRAAYGVRSNPGLQQRLAAHLEEAFLSVERLRGHVSRLFHDQESAVTASYRPICRTCRYWDEQRSGSDDAYVPCLHPVLSEAGLMVSPHSSCKQHEPRA
ncbi:hypothetical protein Pla123a_46220 [Posidoniimonas polymericola]|uniref:Uncharacterized protein n=1 Tax=Posidoniimonas polymericola TaxID=2528002 RepID=A0A5C5XUY9_9BACT|nr:hypothetical protein [Posidoniimonas polymericola]TWT66734.1 hypothetical protein Pla123a_46220 [Posidoniimonas polymericola]